MVTRKEFPSRAVAALLAVAMICSACAPSIVQIKPPYHGKLRPGDGVKVLDKSGVLHSGRIVYLDNDVIVLRTPKQTISNNPVKEAKFGVSMRWDTIKAVKVAGTLDSQRKLISNEEIRVNRRTNLRQKLMANVGVLGLAASFLIGSAIQDRMAPADPANLTGNHGKARFTFWATTLLGTAASVGVGYKVGSMLDDRRAIDRIERARAELRRKAMETASRANTESVYGTPVSQ